MAAAAAKKQQPPPQAAASTGGPAAVVHPKFECVENSSGYVLRLPLPGFRKDNFRVQVDGARRVTVRGTRPGTAGTTSLCKVFQLPSDASLDDIAGRFQAGVLTLTVPKHATGAGVAAPTSLKEITRVMPGVAKESKPKEEEEVAKEDALKKKTATEEAANKADEKKQQEEEEEAKSRKKEQQKPVPSPAVKKDEEELRPKATHAAAAAPPPETPAAAASPPEKPAPKKPESATGADKAKAAVAPDTLADRVRRRGEEDGANVAAKRAKTDGEKKKAAAACDGWKERVQGELKAVTDMKWADGMVEAARKNKEVVAIGIAAISLGVLVCHKLYRK